MRPNTLRTFWTRVRKTAYCWPWIGTRDTNGYGRFQIVERVVKPHRLSWELANGPIPEGMVVCHSCDNPPCVNPDHLFLGTIADNNADRDAKGRNIHGERHASSKLTEDDVIDIRTAYAMGAIQIDLAKVYGVSQTMISAITRRHSWKHLP